MMLLKFRPVGGRDTEQRSPDRGEPADPEIVSVGSILIDVALIKIVRPDRVERRDVAHPHSIENHGPADNSLCHRGMCAHARRALTALRGRAPGAAGWPNRESRRDPLREGIRRRTAAGPRFRS